jgi:hypothetical protein
MSRHRTTIEAEVRFHVGTDPIGGDDMEIAYPKIDVTFSYQRGSPGRFNSINGGHPPEPAEIEIISAVLVNGDGLDPTPEQVREWAERFAEDDGFDHLCDVAEDQLYHEEADHAH